VHLICRHYLALTSSRASVDPPVDPPLLLATAARDLRPPLLLGPPPPLPCPLQPPLHCPLPARIFLLHSITFSLGFTGTETLVQMK